MKHALMIVSAVAAVLLVGCGGPASPESASLPLAANPFFEDTYGTVMLPAQLQLDGSGNLNLLVRGQAAKGQVTSADWSEASAAFTDPGLLSVLDAGGCGMGVDTVDQMAVTVGGVKHAANVVTCNDPSVAKARTVVQALVAKYGPQSP